jgi:NAD(P) transhydrogenase subunit alpha
MWRQVWRAGLAVTLVTLVWMAVTASTRAQDENQRPERSADDRAAATAESRNGDREVSPSDLTAGAGPADAAGPGPDAAASRPSKSDMLIASITIFVLAIFIGFEVITKVPPTLHTPLMSGSNAISGITIVGALIVAGHAGGFASGLGFLAVVLAMINVVGGFVVTHRMLAMFKKR